MRYIGYRCKESTRQAGVKFRLQRKVPYSELHLEKSVPATETSRGVSLRDARGERGRVPDPATPWESAAAPHLCQSEGK